MWADRDKFSHTPTCHITGRWKVNKFYSKLILSELLVKGKSLAKQNTSQPYSFKILAMTKPGITDAKSFASFSRENKNKILKSLCSEAKWLWMPLPQVCETEDYC